MKKSKYAIFVGLSSLYAMAFLAGCSNVVLFDPKGPIGDGERYAIIVAFALMLIVVIPALVMAFWFALRYRASNTNATYTPKWSYSGKIDMVVWLVPIAIITALGSLAWNKTHQLDPYKPIDPGVKPISIEVVSLNWIV